MGIEVQGKKPASAAGKVFRSEFWAWRPIHALMADLCADLLEARTLEGMAFGRGTGANDQATCSEIADRLERWQTQHPGGLTLDAGIRTTPEGRFVTEQELADNSSMETVSPYRVDDEQMLKWITFLRNCGGFEVW